jgi:hypothetical protein
MSAISLLVLPLVAQYNTSDSRFVRLKKHLIIYLLNELN